MHGLSQAKNNSIARQRACDESKNAYAAELQKTNQVQHEHYHTLMPKVFEVCLYIWGTLWVDSLPLTCKYVSKKNNLIKNNIHYHCTSTTDVVVKSHGKERLRKKALTQPRKSDIEGAEVTCWGQTVPSRGSSNREGLIANMCDRHTFKDSEEVGSRHLCAWFIQIFFHEAALPQPCALLAKTFFGSWLLYSL